jgi:hypothetical protein
MGFVIALKYFGIFLAVVVAILYIMAVLDVKLDGLPPSRLKFAGLYVMVTFFGGLMLLTALVSFLYKSYNITKKSLLFFLIITPLLGVMLGTLAAEIGHAEMAEFGMFWSPLDGVPLKYILVSFAATVLIGQWGFDFARRIWTVPE